MEKIDKFPKANRVFVKDPKVLEFIEYCKNKYSKSIRKLTLTLYDEDDADDNEWQFNVSECSENNKQGMVWAPWFMPTITNFSSSSIDISKYNIKVIKKY